MLREQSADVALMELHLAGEGSAPADMKTEMSVEHDLWLIGPRNVDPDHQPGLGDQWFGRLETPRIRSLAEKGIFIENTTHAPGGEVALKFVEAGLGYLLLPGYMARPSWKAGQIIRLQIAFTHRVSFGTLARQPLSPCVQRLLDFLRPRWEAESKRQRKETQLEMRNNNGYREARRSNRD